MNCIMAVVSSLAIFSAVMFGIAPAANSYMTGTHERIFTAHINQKILTSRNFTLQSI
ncbi:MAG: hypothetical protein KGI25_03670 [Thaumarchaeota archaeon]|nr:hypothetical protein [Nitrososphaerota archaeon]